MVEYKYILPGTIVWRFKDVLMSYRQCKEEKIGPNGAELIYEIAPPCLAKKRSHNDQRENNEQECDKKDKPVNSEQHLYES